MRSSTQTTGVLKDITNHGVASADVPDLLSFAVPGPSAANAHSDLLLSYSPNKYDKPLSPVRLRHNANKASPLRFEIDVESPFSTSSDLLLSYSPNKYDKPLSPVRVTRHSRPSSNLR